MNWTDTDHDYNPEIEQMIEDRLFASEEAERIEQDLFEGGAQ
jgi:hypothetical protein